MSAPSDLHEERVALLDARAVLSGHLVLARLALRETPDVVRLDPARQHLFVGDAKATETPGCAATQARVHAYLRATRRWSRHGFTARVALCHGRPDQAPGWTDLLLHAARCAAVGVTRSGCDDLEPGTVVTWVDLGPTRPQLEPEILDEVGANH